jgi:hypothetical protein
MDKTIILAVAGSGKSSYLIGKLNLSERFLLLTYTINNEKNLREAIIRKFGFLPNNIELVRYYNFLYHSCYLPFLGYKIRANGYQWELPPSWTKNIKRNEAKFYLTSDRRLYHNRVAKLLEYFNILEDIKQRLSTYYDYLFIDEVQDFAGHDFNLLLKMLEANINVLLVGDFYQHTFDTSRDGNVNANLHKEYKKYLKLFNKAGVIPNEKLLSKSWRCAPEICEFITSNLDINIQSHHSNKFQVYLLIDQRDVDQIFNDNTIVKLFYQESSKYDCFAKNWGDCKGEDLYEDVCVVLNKTSYTHYQMKSLKDLPPVSKNKLYVACSRARHNLYLIPEELIKMKKK